MFLIIPFITRWQARRMCRHRPLTTAVQNHTHVFFFRTTNILTSLEMLLCIGHEMHKVMVVLRMQGVALLLMYRGCVYACSVVVQLVPLTWAASCSYFQFQVPFVP